MVCETFLIQFMKGEKNLFELVLPYLPHTVMLMMKKRLKFMIKLQKKTFSSFFDENFSYVFGINDEAPRYSSSYLLTVHTDMMIIITGKSECKQMTTEMGFLARGNELF